MVATSLLMHFAVELRRAASIYVESYNPLLMAP